MSTFIKTLKLQMQQEQYYRSSSISDIGQDHWQVFADRIQEDESIQSSVCCSYLQQRSEETGSVHRPTRIRVGTETQLYEELKVPNELIVPYQRLLTVELEFKSKKDYKLFKITQPSFFHSVMKSFKMADAEYGL